MTISSSSIDRLHQPGLVATRIQRGSVTEIHGTFRLLPGENAPGAARRLVEFLDAHQATVVRVEGFGSLALSKEMLNALRSFGGKRLWPVTWVEAKDCFGKSLAGVHVMAWAGAHVRPLKLDGTLAGVLVEEPAAQHCFVSGLQPDNAADSRPAQVGRLYERLEKALLEAGMDLSRLVRTWFFLEDILSWYGEFNEVRNEVYVQRRMAPGSVPASTGIGARNPGQTAAIVGAWAVRSAGSGLTARTVGSPLQCSAPSYGSGFSRAMELQSAELRRLLVSGTASIDPRGMSVHQGDIDAQVDLTMRVLEALLASRKMSFADVTRATAYLKHARDAAALSAWCRRHNLDDLPLVVTNAEVCRDELLFELELDAVSTRPC